MAVVKANGYGLGATAISKSLSGGGADYFGVATLYEGIALRKAGIKKGILMLGPLDAGELESALGYGLTPSVYKITFLEALEETAFKSKAIFKAHIKVDTGMGRVGFGEEQIDELIKKLKVSKHIKIEGFFSTLASADHPGWDQSKRQISVFNSMLKKLEQAGIRPPLVHLANSAGLLFHPGARLTMVRSGIAMYGFLPDTELENPGLTPAVRFETKILQIKEYPKGSEIGYSATYKTKKREKLALLPIGYADGLPRIIGEKRGYVLIRGRKAPFRGRISMDLAMVSIEGIDAREGDPVTLWGKEGEEEITPWDWAKMAGTIPYEITSGISPRVPRLYTFKNKRWSEVPFLS